MSSSLLDPPPGGLQLAQVRATDPSAIAAADYAARHWTSDEAGDLRLGSDAHKHMAARMFRETFNPYKPTIIDWPKLADHERERLINLPIWDIAVQTEGKACIRMLSYAYSLTDPVWRDAIELNGWEEGRHKTVLSNLVEAYGIVLEPEPAYPAPRHTEWAYLATGFSECIDSFFAFGLFAMAERSGFFRVNWWIRSSRSCRKNAGTFCCSPTGWPGTAATWPGGGASGSSCALPQPGCFSAGNASGWRAAWTTAMAAPASRRTTTSPSMARKR